MRKYSIGKEFFPYSLFTPPIRNAAMAGWMGSLMRPPRWIRHGRAVTVRTEIVRGDQDAEIEVLIFQPCGIGDTAPCLVYYHGGGFFFEGAGYHYKLTKAYALQTPCKVVFVQYRLAPKHPFPIPVEDCLPRCVGRLQTRQSCTSTRLRSPSAATARAARWQRRFAIWRGIAARMCRVFSSLFTPRPTAGCRPSPTECIPTRRCGTAHCRGKCGPGICPM